jgi:hypothetical protein
MRASVLRLHRNGSEWIDISSFRPFPETFDLGHADDARDRRVLLLIERFDRKYD